jgi:hypothetical protein
MTQELPPIVNISDLDTFVRALVHWHTNKIALLKHMLELPEGTEVSNGDGPPVTLTGDVLAAFKAGLQTALIELGELPFTFALEDEDTPPAASNGPLN